MGNGGLVGQKVTRKRWGFRESIIFVSHVLSLISLNSIGK